MTHPPKMISISNSYESPYASICTLPLSEDTTYLNELLEKEKRELADELIWLRETSKAAIQEYVDEVEYLLRQCSVYTEAEVQFNAQLTESRAKEEVWRLRCLAAEKIQSMPCEYDKSHADSLPRPQSAESLEEVNEACSFEISDDAQKLSGEKILRKIRDKIRSWSSGNLLLMEEDAKSLNVLPTTRMHSCSNTHPSCIDKAVNTKTKKVLNQSFISLPMENLHDNNSTKIPEEDYFIERVEQTADETSKEDRSYLFGNTRCQEDLYLTISSRDQVIVSLEQTLNQELCNMQNMQAEIVCLIQAQGIKEKSLCSTHEKKEKHLEKLIKSLREKLKVNEMSTKEHNETLSACKLYIQELTAELERMLKTVKRAEGDRSVLDCNVCT